MIHLNFVIKQSDVASVIGNHGSNVKQLESKTNTKIAVQRDLGTLQRDFHKYRRIKINGAKDDVVNAIVEVVNTITPEKDAPFLQVYILLGEEETTRESLTLGQKEGLRKFDSINAEINARVKTVSLGPFDVIGIEILSTLEEDLNEGISSVVDWLEDEGLLGQSTSDRQSMLKLAKKSIDEQVKAITSREAVAFLVPYDKTSRLIGPKGATIKELEKDHDVNLVVEKPDSSYCTIGRTVLVRGTIDNIGKCLAEATKKIFEGDDLAPRVIMLLPPGVPRYLIGHSGETIKRVEKESGCNLEVERAETRINGELAGPEYDIEYCQICGTEETIVKGIQGVAARVLIQLDIQGQTSEATIPAGADFGRFVQKALAVDTKAMIRRNARMGFADGGGHPPHSWPAKTHPDQFGPSRLPSRGVGYGDRAERRQQDDWPVRSRPTNQRSWPAERPYRSIDVTTSTADPPGLDWGPGEVRGNGDYSPVENHIIEWGPSDRGSNWPAAVSPRSVGPNWGLPSSSDHGGWGASKPWQDIQPTRDPWDVNGTRGRQAFGGIRYY